MKLHGIDIKANTQRWECRTNRHTTTRGYSWGWIEGHGATWSNDPGSPFTSDSAREVVAAHNRWLEESRPVEHRLIDARNLAAQQERNALHLRAQADAAEAKLNATRELIGQLEAQQPYPFPQGAGCSSSTPPVSGGTRESAGGAVSGRRER